MKKNLFVPLLLLVSIYSFAQPAAPPSAEVVMKEACAEALKSGKKVFVMFHASWCGWCHKMDRSMNDSSCKKFFNDNFVIRHLVLDEAKDKKHLENPGAAEMKSKYHGDGQGIPYWLIFDAKGNLLADSKSRKEGEGPEKGENTGCPATEKEVNYFITVLLETTKLSGNQLELIRKRFRQNEQ